MSLSFERGLVALVTALLCSVGAVARAQSDTLGGTLEYGAAALAAETAAPALVTGQARASVAAAGVGVARIFANPIGSVGTTTDGPRFFSTLTVPLPITRRGSAIRAAESSASAAAAEIPLLRLDARFGAANAWCDLWLAERTVEVARASEQRAAKVLAAANQRFGEGTAPRLDAARANAEHARVRAEALARAELVADASASLAYWLARDPVAVLHVAGAPPDVAALPSITVLAARLDSHPLIAKQAARSRAAAALVGVQESQAWPTFGVQLGATLWDRQVPENNLSAGVLFDVPVFNWNRPAITQARNGVVQVAAESGAATARLRADLVSAYATLKAAVV